MLLLQGICALIITTYLVARLWRAPAPAGVLRRLGLLLLGSFLGEDSMIRAYGFYHYNPGFSLFIDRVPLLIVIIWPIVIDSAWELARRLLPGASTLRLALCGAAFVLLDASLIEPIAVHAGLWAWTEPGLFGVPPVGILGWALFAGACIGLLPRTGAVVVLAPLITHGLLLLCWWLLLRWVSAPLPSPLVAATAWLLLLPLSLWLYRSRLRDRVPPGNLLVRIPGAVFFFALLWHSPTNPALWAYSLAFVPPYLALIRPGDG